MDKSFLKQTSEPTCETYCTIEILKKLKTEQQLVFEQHQNYTNPRVDGNVQSHKQKKCQNSNTA